MGMIKEFRDFAVRGNVMDMAVGIIIGAAFGKIVSSMVSDIMMPPIGRLMGSINFSDLYFSLDPEKTRGIESLAKARETGAAIVAYLAATVFACTQYGWLLNATYHLGAFLLAYGLCGRLASDEEAGRVR